MQFFMSHVQQLSDSKVIFACHIHRMKVLSVLLLYYVCLYIYIYIYIYMSFIVVGWSSFRDFHLGLDRFKSLESDPKFRVPFLVRDT